MTKEDFAVRESALQLAIKASPGTTDPETICTRAEVYEQFLRGTRDKSPKITAVSIYAAPTVIMKEGTVA